VDTQPTIQHWLISVVRAAGLEGAEELDVASDTDPGAAWDLVAMKLGLAEEDLAARVAAHYRLETADLDAADPMAFKLVPGSVARKLQVVPLRYSNRQLIVATADPVSMEAEREISHIAGRAVHFEVAPPGPLRDAVEATYPRAEELRHEIPPLPAEARGGLHVLVVDDDPGTRRLLRTVLEDGGFRVDEAEDGPEALDMLAGDDPFHLVTLDLQMEQMHGLEVLKRIRSRVHTAALPVVVATGSDDPSVEMELFEAGADDFIVKPVDPPRFLLRLQAVLRRRDPSTGFGKSLGLPGFQMPRRD